VIDIALEVQGDLEIGVPDPFVSVGLSTIILIDLGDRN
jgi:hypothetical protein